VIPATSAAIATLRPPSSWIRSMMSSMSFTLFVVFVEEQMKLVGGLARDLPVVLRVEVAESHRIGEDLVQVLDAVGANRLLGWPE
jgi:hypothetical protein